MIPWILHATSLAAVIFTSYCGDCTMRQVLNSSSKINIIDVRNAERLLFILLSYINFKKCKLLLKNTGGLSLTQSC